jgi:hypothetical protein
MLYIPDRNRLTMKSAASEKQQLTDRNTRGPEVKYLLALAIAFSLTVVWQALSLEQRDAALRSVEQQETVSIPPQAS